MFSPVLVVLRINKQCKQDSEVSIQKSIGFLYTSNELNEKKITKIIPFAVASRKTEYLGSINSIAF